jgi:hypothetical protein
MPGDYTRVTFDPFDDHLGVLMQQGRVMLDADFNELVGIIDRRFRAETIDIIGRCIVPRETPDGFRIQFVAGVLSIGRGRLYAHGLLAENHGRPPIEFDPILAEPRGTLPVPYLEQPYLPNASEVSPLPDGAGPHLVYADVWQREVTHLEEPDLVEKAVGVDTATRLQTVWQVKILSNVGRIACDTRADQIPGWSDIVRPSAGRLTTATAGVPADTDPCVVNPAGGFRGTENRLYRIEIHARGGPGTATFKWSRDNASIATAVTAINAGLDVLTVVRTGRDAELRFQPGDWVEVTDDFHEFAGSPGEMRKVQAVDDVTQTITLAAALTTGEFDAAAPGSRHTRVRRWDQKGQVFDSNNNVVADVDASGGVIPVPASGNIVFEDGVQVEFSVSGTGDFHSADYWLVAARTVDASIDILTQAPPRGIHHHFCRLAIVTFPDIVTDCRTLWPPEFGEGGGCDCTECVSAESHNNGTLTIQMAIDRVKATGGKVCLGPGTFNLTAPVQIQGASSVQLQGHGLRTMLVYSAGGPAIFVSRSTGIDISMLSVLAVNAELAIFALAVQNSVLVRVERCLLFQSGRRRQPLEAAVGLNGFILESTFRDNILLGSTALLAVSSGPEPPGVVIAPQRTVTMLFDMRVENNVIAGGIKGVSLENLTLLIGQNRFTGNTFFGASIASLIATGLVYSDVLTSSRLEVSGNSLVLTGDGIVIGVDNAEISQNDLGVVRGSDASRITGGTGIVLTRGVIEGIDRLKLIGNRVVGLGGDGISIQSVIGSAMIKQNVIEGVRRGGVVMTESAQATNLSIENNQIVRSGLLNDQATRLAAIQTARVRQLQITANTIDQFATPSIQNPARHGIAVVACESVRIEGNDLANIGPPGPFVNSGNGIVVESPFDRIDVGNNSVRRSTIPVIGPAPGADASNWNAVRITSPTFGTTPGSVLFPFVTSFNNGVLVLAESVLAALPLGTLIAGIRGNLLEGNGGDSMVKVLTGASCIFSDNRTQGGFLPQVVPVALVSCTATIVNANFVRRIPSDDAGFSIIVAASGPFTILANIFIGGRAIVNGGNIPAPWAPLNVVTFS